MVTPFPNAEAPAGARVEVLPEASAIDDARVVELYDQYFDFVWRSLRRLGVDGADLDDATQDVFVVVHRRLCTFEERASVKSWVFAIAMRVAKDYRRKSARQRQHQIDDGDVQLVCTRGTPEEAHLKQQAAAQVLHVLEALDDDKRAVFVLAELERMPSPDIAVALGLPLNTVYSRLRLARAAFEESAKRLRAQDEWRYR
jgi:RNA polymerase sigma-70 factor, ECF subfamily